MRGASSGTKMLLQPLNRLADIHAPEVHHQVDGPATTFVSPPVEELGGGHRKRAALSPPLIPVVPITLGAPLGQYSFQRYAANGVGLPPKVARCHFALLVKLVPQALALLHVEDVTTRGQSVEQGRGQLRVAKKRSPVRESQV